MNKFPLLAGLMAFGLATACSSDGDEPQPDASGIDLGLTDLADDATIDAADADDVAKEDLTTPACAGPCAELDLTATVGASTATFDQAVYGLTAPDQSASGEWELHVEVHAGGPAGCPEQSSPTPDQTLIVTGFAVPTAPVTVTETDGLVVSLLDFAGTLTTELPLTGSGEELRFAAWQVCTDCAGDDPDGYLAFDLDAPLSGGSVAGHVWATHCASLDAK